MLTDVVARPFAPDDKDFIMSLAPRLVIGIPAWRDPAKMLAAVEGWLEESIAQHGDKTVVFVAEGAAQNRLGFATVSRSKHFTGVPQAELGELVVAADAEGRGVGRALVGACSAWAIAQGYAFLALGTGAANTQARSFYKRLGFWEEDVRLVKLLQEQPAE